MTKRTRRWMLAAIALIVIMAAVSMIALAEGEEAPASPFYKTFWSLLPPIIAIALALITKEVYTSLFVGIIVGGLLYANFNLEVTLTHAFNNA